MVDRFYVLPRLRRLSPALATLYAGRGGPYAALLDRLATGRGPLDRAEVLAVRPTLPEVNRLERDAGRLREAAKDAFDAVLKVFARTREPENPRT